MKKTHLFPLLLFWGITSCSIVKQLHQDKTEVKIEISSLEKTFKESQIVTTTKVSEKKDSILVLPGSELSMSAKFQDLLVGDTIYAAGEGLSLKRFYDSLTKTIKTQADGLRYAEFVVPLVKAVQELKAENDALKARLDALEALIKKQ